MKTLSFEKRLALTTQPVARRLLETMIAKKSNLSLAADVTTAKDLFNLAEQAGPHIAIFKTHIDILRDFTPRVTEKLQQLADHYQFLIFEDRKFADIGHTVFEQLTGGIYHIADWAHIINAHTLPGPGIIESIQSVNKNSLGLLLLAEMSSAGQLADQQYTEKTVAMALQYPQTVIGFIAQHGLSSQPHLITCTPGVQLQSAHDTFGQCYHSPEKIITEQGSDVAIVGRGITQAEDVTKASAHYQRLAWAAYEHRLLPTG